jgi:serine/threonine protein kinase
MINQIINNKYFVIKLIGEGKFGAIYQGKNIKTDEPIALKLERANSPIKLLKNETNVLNYLYSQGCRNIPQVHWYGKRLENMCLVMPLYDCSLFEYTKLKSLTDPDKIRTIIERCVSILKHIHRHYVVHRDIKPQNIMIKNNIIYFIDFGFASYYMGYDDEHLPLIHNYSHIVGTPKYVSIHIHDGTEYSRRDDLISLGYVYIWLLTGHLPWDNIYLDQETGDHNECYTECHIKHPKNLQRKQLKSLQNIERLYGTSHPKLFQFFTSCYSLEFDKTPNYEALL